MRLLNGDLGGKVLSSRVKRTWVALAIVIAGLGAAFGLSQRIDRGVTTLDVLTVRSILTQQQLQTVIDMIGLDR